MVFGGLWDKDDSKIIMWSHIVEWQFNDCVISSFLLQLTIHHMWYTVNDPDQGMTNYDPDIMRHEVVHILD